MKKLKKAVILLFGMFLFVGPNFKDVRCVKKFNNNYFAESKSMSGTAGSDSNCDYKHSLKNQMYNYFNNLYDYSPKNFYGTCGYVSLSQVLAYFDNFYDGRIIESQFNSYKNKQSSYLLDSELVSPGVERGDYNNQYGSFSSTVISTCSFDYQYQLVKKYKEHLDSKKANENTTITYDNSLCASQAAELVNNCLTYKPNKVTTYMEDSKSQKEYYDMTKNAIDQGYPVILNIGKKKTGGGWNSGHAVVAYDYLNNNIYANFGWDKADTHKPITYYGHDIVVGILIIEYGSNAGSKLNYQIGDNKIDYLSFYNRAVLNPSKYSDSNGYPTFVWKHSSDSSEYFDVEIGAIQTGGSFYKLISGTTSYNRFILSYQAMQYLYGAAQSGIGIYISIKRYEKNGIVKYNYVTSCFY